MTRIVDVILYTHWQLILLLCCVLIIWLLSMYKFHLQALFQGYQHTYLKYLVTFSIQPLNHKTGKMNIRYTFSFPNIFTELVSS